jgi:DNA-directed RNA polymerase specialized sigma24 family protein
MIDNSLLEQKYDTIKAIAYSVAKSTGFKIDQEDLTQDICITLLTSKKKTSEDNFTLHVYDIAKSAVRKNARKSDKVKFEELTETLANDHDLTCVFVRDFLAELSEQEKRIIDLISSGYSTSELRKKGIRTDYALSSLRQKLALADMI